MEFEFKPQVDSLDNVPENFRVFYEEGDNGFALRDDPSVKTAVASITGLGKSLKAARGERDNLKGQAVDLSPLSEYGATPEEIAEGIQAKLQESAKGKKTQEDFLRQVEKVKADLGAEYGQKIEAEQTRAEALKNQLHSILVTGEARSALAEAGAIDADLALPFLAQQVKVAEEDGKFQVMVVDQAGDPRYSGTTGAPMSVRELVGEMKGQEKFGPLFKSDQRSGSGAPANGQRRAAPTRGRDEMSSREKIAAGLRKGQATRAGQD